MTEVVAAPVAIDLSRLPAPAVIEALSYETILSELTADFAARWTDFDAFVEGDPALKLLQVYAYREFTLRARFNEVARGNLTPTATGADLDNLAAFYGVQRLVIAPATIDTPAVMESDADLRTRLTYAPELLAGAGRTAGGYVALARSIAPTVKDVAVLKRDGGFVDLVLLGRDGDGSVAPALIAPVTTALKDEAAVQLTDVVSVRAAKIIPYTVEIVIELRFGPDPAVVRAAVEAGIRAYAADRHRVGRPVYRQMLEAAASVGGVERAIVGTPDIIPGADAAAWLAGINLQVAPA